MSTRLREHNKIIIYNVDHLKNIYIVQELTRCRADWGDQMLRADHGEVWKYIAEQDRESNFLRYLTPERLLPMYKKHRQYRDMSDYDCRNIIQAQFSTD